MIDPFPKLNPTLKGLSLSFLATLGMANVYIFSKAAKKIPLLSRASNLTPIFVTILGIRFLGDKFNAIEAIGIILTIGGVILITYTRDTTIQEFFGKGSGWILVSSTFSSISIVTAKSRIKDIHPGILTVNRVIVMTWGKMKYKTFNGAKKNRGHPRPLPH